MDEVGQTSLSTIRTIIYILQWRMGDGLARSLGAGEQRKCTTHRRLTEMASTVSKFITFEFNKNATNRQIDLIGHYEKHCLHHHQHIAYF